MWLIFVPPWPDWADPVQSQWSVRLLHALLAWLRAKGCYPMN